MDRDFGEGTKKYPFFCNLKNIGFEALAEFEKIHISFQDRGMNIGKS